MSDSNVEIPLESRSRSILELSSDEARTFLLKKESYCNFDLPPYFDFSIILEAVAGILNGNALGRDVQCQSPRDFDDVNHTVLNNKDGRHAWRPFQLIHPALYVSLVNQITSSDHWKTIKNRFGQFSANKKISCLSVPVESLTDEVDKAEQITQWWMQVEQASLELALDYEFIIHSDITDCYGQIYTHSIAWAVHTKPEAKKKENRRDHSLLGNVIDDHIQDMRHGQTNGIPQGSVLMDLIAELVLGYADHELTTKIDAAGIEDYKILRYRDDYRIFVNNSRDGDHILKLLTEVMIDLGMKLSPAKTKVSDQVVRSSVKEDKLSWICRRQLDRSFQKHLMLIHDHSLAYPNSGSLAVALKDFHKRIVEVATCHQPLALISIVVDIAFRNPRTYAVCSAIISKLISQLGSDDERLSVVKKIELKFSRIPNTGHLFIWLQRICLPFAPEADFNEPLCHLVAGENATIWNSDWISAHKIKEVINETLIVDRDVVEQLDAVVPVEEVSLFADHDQHSL